MAVRRVLVMSGTGIVFSSSPMHGWFRRAATECRIFWVVVVLEVRLLAGGTDLLSALLVASIMVLMWDRWSSGGFLLRIRHVSHVRFWFGVRVLDEDAQQCYSFQVWYVMPRLL